MKISFGRIIPIKSISNPNHLSTNKRVDCSTFEVAKVLNGERSSVYSRRQAQSIRDFFEDILGDYNGEDGILIRRTESGDLYLFSGKDAEVRSKQEYENGRYATKIDIMPYRGKEAEIILSSSKLPESKLSREERNGLKPIKTKIDRFQYIGIESYFTARIDGHIRIDLKRSNKPTPTNRSENIIVDYKELNLGL